MLGYSRLTHIESTSEVWKKEMDISDAAKCLLPKEKEMKKCVWALVFFSAIYFGSGSVWADYPEKPITLIITQSPGGSSDVTARALADSASKILGRPIVVSNRPGGGGSVGLTMLKGQKADGYTIGNIVTGSLFAPYYRKTDYDPNKDFTPIIRYGDYTIGVVVRSDSPWTTFKQLVDYAKANPGKIRYGTSGPATIHHLPMEYLAKQEGIKWIHMPFAGCSPALTAILGGHTEVMVCSTEWKPYVDNGRLRLLSTHGAQRIPQYPNVPTWIELGYNISINSLLGFVGPKGLPRPIVDKLNDAFKMAMDSPEFKKAMVSLDMPIIYRNPEGLAKDMKDLTDKWGPFISQLGIKED